jgi:hypothetical protein
VTLGNVGLYGEAVSNAYLKREALLDNEALRALTTMGWSGGGAGSNFSRTWERWTGTDRRQVVDDIVGTLRLVYEMPPTGPLDITTGS